MISMSAIRCILNCPISARIFRPRVVSHLIRLLCVPPFDRRSQYLGRTFFSTTIGSQKLLPSTVSPPNRQLRHEDFNSTIALHRNIQRELLDKKTSLSEVDVLLALQACQSYATAKSRGVSNTSAGVTPTAALFSLDDDQGKQAAKQHPLRSTQSPSKNRSVLSKRPLAKPVPGSPSSTPACNFEPLADIAYKLISHPSVFVTTPILASYVSLQSQIRDPSPIPAAFSLYANKPFTPPNSTKIIQPRPTQAKYAIPSTIASAALDVAIEAKDMSLCLDIIDTSFGAGAYQRSKLVRGTTPAAVVGCFAPAAIYILADTLAGYQDEIDHSLAVKYAFVGMLVYVCFTGSIGIIAQMTANDQMVRVTWIAGTPLRQRWLREEERAALDRVAQAWGFQELNRRGFEEGEEWELLREVVNRKGMYLDNPALMEGMQ